MATVAILGGGELGGALAFALARRSCAREIRLIDPSGGVAAGKALDILQAGPIERFATTLRGSDDLAAAIGASVIAVCDAAQPPGTEWQGEVGLALMRQVIPVGVRPAVVFAGSEQRDLMLQAHVELGWPRERLLGSAPEAVAAALRAMVAIEADGSPQDVSIMVTGVPGRRLVVSWTAATIGGEPLTRVLTAVGLARLEARAARLWPPGPYALASAASRAIEALLAGSRHRFCALAVLDGELGVRRRVAAVPVSLRAPGFARVIEPALGPRERVEFETAVTAKT